MGAYVYRITSKRVKCSDGQEANVAVYAYKPSWGDEKLNRRWHFQTGCSRSDSLAAQGLLTDRVVTADKDGVVDGDRVYRNGRKVGHFYDDSFFIAANRVDGVTVA